MSKQRTNFVRPDRRQLLKYAGALAAGAVASPFVGHIERAFAAWPADRPVRIVVANSPGGPSDLIARFLAPALQETLGGSFIVENRPGGGGNIGMSAVIRSDADGYALLLSTSVWVINPSLYDPPPYDAVKDLVPVAELATSPSVFVVRSDLGVNSMKEFVELAKKNQDKFNISTPPISTTLHLGAALFKIRTGLDKVALDVHTGGGQAIQALLSGSVQMCSSSLAPAHAQIQGGTLKGLMILGDERWHDLPNVPTAAEAGFKDFNFETYTALMAPAKTPPEIVSAIEKASIAALRKPDVMAKLTKAGFQVQAKTGAQHRARIEKEVPMFREITRSAGIKAK